MDTINKAINLIENIDFDKAFTIIKEQPLEPFAKIDEINYDEALEEKIKWIVHYKNEIDKAIDKQFIIERWARKILRHEQTINKIRGGGWFINMPLLGQIWAISIMVLNEYKKLNSPKENKQTDSKGFKSSLKPDVIGK